MTPPRKKQRLSLDGENSKVKADKPVEDAVAAATDGKETTTAAKDGDKDATSQRRSLFVRSLPATTTTESLTEIFSQSYPIKHATAVTDKESKQCKGYGFVTFADADDCQRAKEEFNGFIIEGKKLRCEVAEPRQRDQEAGAAPSVSAGQKFKDEREKQKAEYQPPKLIVRNLPWSIKGPNQLTKLFQSYGKVKYAVVPMKKPGLLSGFGFVTMRGRKNAEKAIEGVNGKEVDGRTLAVDWAVDRDAWKNETNPEKEGEDEDEEAAEEMDVDDGAEDGAEEHIDDGTFDEDGESGSDDDANDEDADMDEDEEKPEHDRSDNSSTLFIRNLPFTCTDEDLEDHFSQFGATRYARIVLDRNTERPRGTGFVCFYNLEDADNCIREAPRQQQPPRPADARAKDPSSSHVTKSILQNDESDPSGRYTLDGRVLQVSRAVNQREANRLTQEGVDNRFKRDTDKRRLYLLHEGTIPSNSPQWEKLSPSEQTMREASVKQRKSLIESNPSLSLSLTRLSVRNIPRTITSADLKALAREAFVGFAKDVKAGVRQPLSKEELARGGEEMQNAEKDRRARAKGVVKQAKIVFEGREGSKVDEKSGAGRSRGYGFIEYYTHRSALMGLRWLNGHAIGYQAHEPEAKGKKVSKEVIAERKKRLIVEFAIENAVVVARRKEREDKMQERHIENQKKKNEEVAKGNGKNDGRDKKRKRGPQDTKDEAPTKEPEMPAEEKDKLAKRQQIIQKKRMARRARKQGAK
ncbi:hypothetical protein BDV97DRAFT_342434 [Delphinella strobiligena]|nr:hypothetical protein BDV97DRAFT_342434 [Delphinella strobiligena]